MSRFKMFAVYVVFISLLNLVTKTEQTVTTTDCGTTKGCLRVPAGCVNTDCNFVAKYSYQQDLVVFELFGKNSEWVSIGFNDKQEMVGTDSVICYVNNTVFIKSAELLQKTSPTLEEANDLNLTYSSGNRSIHCRFTHPIRPNNASKLRNLDAEFYLIYATGEMKNNALGFHYTLYGVSTYHVNLTKTNESRAASDGIATDGCGKTIGCLRYPKGCHGTDCDYMATYRYQGDHVLFEIFGKEASWVSIGFSDNNEMPDTDAVICHIAVNQTAVIKRSRMTERRRPPLVAASNLDLTGRSYYRKNIQCRFSHPFTPNSGSGLRNLSQTVFLLYAKGDFDLNDTEPFRYHSSKESHRGASPKPVDLQTAEDIALGEPDKGVQEGISTAGCGKTMECLRYQPGCNGSSCEFVATYSYQPATKNVTFELFGKNAEWVAIGFSEDDRMPNTDSVFCYNSGGNILIRSGRLVSRSLPSLEEEKDLVLLEQSTDGGGIRCKFTHPLTPGSASKLRSLDQEIYLLYAKGLVSGNPSQHAASASGRGFSEERVNVTKTVEAETTTPSQLKKKVHGSLMTVVWILLASSGLFFARYTRQNWPDTELLGTKVWFQFHRVLMAVVVLGTIASIVIIFVDLDGFTEHEGTVKTHAIIGLVVFLLAVLQPIGALLRPHPGTPKRPYFNFFHRSLGVSAFVMSVVTIILGLDFFKKDEAYYTVIGYAVFLAFVIVIMEISKFLYDRAQETVHDATVPGGMQMEISIVEGSSFHRTLSKILLGVLDVVSLAVTIVVIYYINKDDEEVEAHTH
ncbi:ferric-chelate reductase 1-like isoform X2 [Dendronephthya gigantea]|uniref:ferric-chelate reductase 1-like isoform X2 n=1 Tax=Dendronephthya gigantea TaxID=151771 RepID=UPI00106B6ECA|nr:ferric-chelate reductase 1-like isoform X2 [Dendronephthya gigantea]